MWLVYNFLSIEKDEEVKGGAISLVYEDSGVLNSGNFISYISSNFTFLLPPPCNAMHVTYKYNE